MTRNAPVFAGSLFMHFSVISSSYCRMTPAAWGSLAYRVAGSIWNATAALTLVLEWEARNEALRRNIIASRGKREVMSITYI
jgi:hypothetical protein